MNSCRHKAIVYIAPTRTRTSFRFQCYAHCRSCLFKLVGKAVSSCNNCGKQRCSDNLTAAIVISTIQKTVKHRFFSKARCFAAELQIGGFSKIDVSQLKKCLMNSWISGTTIAAVRLSLQRCLPQLLQLETAFANQLE